MANNVNTAFKEFLKEKVNLDSSQSSTAIKSKDWLINQLQSLSRDNDDFPPILSSIHLHYGSFARKTKTRPLNDIDLMIGIMGIGSTYDLYSSTHATISANPNIPSLVKLCDPYTSNLNSIKVINCFIKYLPQIYQYRNAVIKRNQEAAVLDLSSYDWKFDIVPSFITDEDSSGKTFYLIPDGYGKWKKTDPRIDRDRLSQINQANSGNVLNVIRIIKFWNKRRNVTTIPSYLLENIILNYYAHSTSCSAWVDLEVADILTYLASTIYNPVYDPKGIQGDLNNLSWDEKSRISKIATEHAAAARKAREYESANNHHMSTLYWYDVFGDDFPRWS
ncbi:hypothetical protein B0I27_104228 [Arcticibacter pallidicorallinus]|uniref:Nucleotidyltransferase n=1 Tax=Arcticibacter pallidicorallinus TaxID=1259464 RepID=A0A2T0U5T3_9SPHI|nr:nucleotidyltransferase [Arcticibacter pallidicorallinus]PRY53218.1 hypothetical protein B0I27_104228 [Arcticibacter pallidicorallinus]